MGSLFDSEKIRRGTSEVIYSVMPHMEFPEMGVFDSALFLLTDGPHFLKQNAEESRSQVL